MLIPLDQLSAIAESLTKIIGLAGLTGAIMDTEGFAQRLGGRLNGGKQNERKITFAKAFLETDETIPEESKKWIRQRLNPSNNDMKALFAASNKAEVREALIKLELIPNQSGPETQHQMLHDLMCNALFKEGDAATKANFINESMREALNLLRTLHGKLATKTKLELLSKTWDKDKEPSEVRLLQPEYQIVYFGYRKTEIQDLDNWLQGADLSIRLYTAAGGTGKTRLFQEWCRQRQNASWQAGFFKPNPTDTAALLELDSPLIVVIDYAESEQEHLIEFLKTCEAQFPQRSSPIRVVLLEREKQVLEATINQHRREIEALDSFKVIALEALDTTRENIYIDARAAFGTKLIGTPFHNQATPDLSADVYDRVLMIHIRALLDTKSLPLISDNTLNTTRGLLDAMLDRERDLWDKKLRTKGMGSGNEPLKDGLRDVLAMTTLGHQTNDRDNLEQLLKVVFPDKDAQTRANLADVLATTHPDGHGGIEALQPDLLGERLVQLALEGSRRNPIIHTLFCNSNMPINFLRAFTVVSRLSGWQQEAGKKIVNAIEKSITRDRTRAVEIFEVMPDFKNIFTIAARSAIGKEAVLLTKEKYDKTPNEANSANYAVALGNQSTNYSANHENRAAFATSQKAVDILRELEKSNSKKYTLNLAKGLENFGILLSKNGEYEQAVSIAGEAVNFHRSFAKSEFTLDLANSLINLGIRQIEFKNYELALKTIKEVLDRYKSTYSENRVNFLSNIVIVLDVLNENLEKQSKIQEICQIKKEITDIYREFFQKKPSDYGYRFVKSLYDFIKILINLGKYDNALEIMLNESEYFQNHHQIKNPFNVFYFNNQFSSFMLNINSKFQIFSKMTDEYNMLSLGEVSEYKFEIAIDLDKFSVKLSGIKKYEQALQISQISVGFMRSHKKNSQGQDLYLANALNNLGNRLGACENYLEALETTQEALAIYRCLDKKNQQGFKLELAANLDNLGNRFSDLGQYKEAINAAREAVGIWGQLGATDSGVYEPELAHSCYLLGDHLKENRQIDLANGQYLLSIQVLKQHFFMTPEKFGLQMASVIRDYLESCKVLNLKSDAELVDPVLQKLKEIEAIE